MAGGLRGAGWVTRALAAAVSVFVTVAFPANAEVNGAAERRAGLDATFGGDGRLKLDGFSAIADVSVFERGPHAGEIVAVGQAGGATIARFRPNGRPDPDFGDDGRITLRYQTAVAVEAYPDGSILLVVSNGAEGGRTSVYRIDAEGDVDIRFGRNGSLDLEANGGPFAASLGAPTVTASSTDRRGLLLGGHINRSGPSEDQAFIAKITHAGKFDRRFNGDGDWFSPRAPQDEYGARPEVEDLLVADGRPVALVSFYPGEPPFDFDVRSALLVGFDRQGVETKLVADAPEQGTDFPHYRALAKGPGSLFLLGGTDSVDGEQWGFTQLAGFDEAGTEPLYAEAPIFNLAGVRGRGFIGAGAAPYQVHPQDLSQIASDGYFSSLGPELDFPPVVIERQRQAVIVGGRRYSAPENPIVLARWRPPALP